MTPFLRKWRWKENKKGNEFEDDKAIIILSHFSGYNAIQNSSLNTFAFRE